MKFRKKINEIDGWQIVFRNNVHMYCHELTVSKNNKNILVPCEDLTTKERTIGIWIDNIIETEEVKKELKSILSEWSKGLEAKTEIYFEK